MLFGSCQLIVTSTNYFQIVRRQCCLVAGYLKASMSQDIVFTGIPSIKVLPSCENIQFPLLWATFPCQSWSSQRRKRNINIKAPLGPAATPIWVGWVTTAPRVVGFQVWIWLIQILCWHRAEKLFHSSKSRLLQSEILSSLQSWQTSVPSIIPRQ